MTVTINGTTGASLSAPASVPQTALASNVAGNGPAFSAYLSANQTITPSAFVKAAINTKEFDTGNNFDVALSRFTPLVAGYYQVNFAINFALSTSATRASVSLYKNGVVAKRGADIVSSGLIVSGSALVFMNGTTDYLELFAFISATTAVVTGDQGFTYLQAFLARSA